MRVLVRPCYEEFLNNRQFLSNHPLSDNWLEPYTVLKNNAREVGILIDT